MASHPRAKEVFLAALAQPSTARLAFVVAACDGDEALRADVQSLLAAHDESAPLVVETGGQAVARAEPFAPGQLFAGRYRMVARLGRGGMGDVWRADDLILAMPVALKVMRATTPVGQTLLLNEVRLARRVTHPAVCRVFDIGEQDGQLFLSMELVDGEDLAALVHRVGRLPPEKVVEIARQLCEALAAAHAQGILHRDLKPANILIDAHGQVRITDFGIAVARDHTGPSTGVGSPGYMAPEQLASGGSLSERTDVYALGLVLYELLVGRGPERPAADGSTPPPPSSLVPDVPRSLDRIVTEALSPDPRRRPPSAAAMAAALSAPPPALRRRRATYGIAAAALLAVVAAIVLLRPFAGGGSSRTLSDRDTLLLGDFVNSTGEPVFDRTLKVALAVALEQSPFIKVFPDERVAQTLRLMNRPADERITGAVAREIAQREHLKALVTGSIGSLGRNYVVAIEAVNSQTGDVMARQQVEAAAKEQVLAALGAAAAKLRETLGESLASVQKYDVPLPKATTSSLEALHAYALALDQDRLVARAGAVPHLKRAIDLDPDFALAHALLSGVYANTGRSALAPEFSRRAFELRDRVSERERFFISWRYYHDAIQDWDKALELARTWTTSYPREPFAFNSLGAALSALGAHEQAVEAFTSASALDPSFVAPLESLAPTLIAVNRNDDARAVVRRAETLRPDLLSLRHFAFLVAMIDHDAAGAANELARARRLGDLMAAAEWEAHAAAFGGRVGAAHDLLQRAADDAVRADFPETAGQRTAVDSEIHAIVQDCVRARTEGRDAIARSRDNFTLERAGRAFALCGATREVAGITEELTNRFANATLTRQLQRPVMAAALALHAGEPRRALAALDPVRPFDEARGAEFWPAYLRGEAYLALADHAQAATQFGRILERRGQAPDSMLYPLARLGMGRATAAAGDSHNARQHYDAFFAMWRDADADLPLLTAARAEYDRLR